MGEFYYTLGKWTFIGGGSALVFYLIIKFETWYNLRRKFNQMDRMEKKFQNKDPNLTKLDLIHLEQSYDWFLEHREKQFPLASDKKSNEMLTDSYKKRFQQHENTLGEILNPTPLPDKKILDGVKYELKRFDNGKVFYRDLLGGYISVEEFKAMAEKEKNK